MNKLLYCITTGILLLTLIVALNGCTETKVNKSIESQITTSSDNKSSITNINHDKTDEIEGRWIREDGNEYWEFLDGKYTYKFYEDIESSTYFVDNDDNLHFDRPNYGEVVLKKVSIDEMKDMNGNQTKYHYAHNDKSMYIMNSAAELIKE